MRDSSAYLQVHTGRPRFGSDRRMAWLAVACCTSLGLTGCGVNGASSTSAPVSTPSPVTGTGAPTTGTIVISTGGTYSGNWSSNDPTTPAVQITTDQPVIIENSTVIARGDLISIAGKSRANVIIRNVTGTALDPQVAGQQRGAFLMSYGMTSLTVQNCTIIGARYGIKIWSSTMSTLNISNNKGSQLEDRASDGKGGFLTTRAELGHFIGIVKVSLPAGGAEVAWNELKQTIGTSSIEDPISIYLSQGANGHPIWIHDNYAEGNSSPAKSTYSGNGITADGDGVGDTGYILIQANQIVHTAGSGVAIATGHDVTAKDNRVVSCGRDASGNWYTGDYTSAITLWNYYNAPNFRNNLITTTGGGLVVPGKGGVPVARDINDISADETNIVTGNNFTDPCLTSNGLNLAVEDAERDAWKAKLATNNKMLGDQH